MTRAAFAMSRLANPEKQLNRLARRAVHPPFVRNVVESLAGRVMVIGVDRLDYSKGIPMRMEAFARFQNAVGPVLNGLFGRKAGAVDGYSYSDGNKHSGIIWDETTFSEYIKDPKVKVPGTKMAFAGIKDEQKIKDLIAYLHTYDKAPVKIAQ
jgi:hypothetical protein